MELQGQNSRVPITQIKTVYPPQGFWRGYPSSISIDCLDAPTCLNIDVAVEQIEEI
jgi:hypothetical protein